MPFFSKFLKSPKKISPTVQLGRYSDVYPASDKYAVWEEAIENFKNKKYIHTMRCVLDFIKREDVNNVSFDSNRGTIHFRILQGSKVIEGISDHSHIRAHARIVKMPSPDLSLMREVLEANYELEYTRYAMDDVPFLLLVFDSFTEDASPEKIYKGLKELATLADKKDDVWLHQFNQLEPIQQDHIQPLPEYEKKVKFEFFTSQHQKLIQEYDNNKLVFSKYPGALSYHILSFIYKTDFLIKPEGFIMESIKKIHDIHMSGVISVHEKNAQMLKMIHQMDSVSFEVFEKEIYRVISTFGEAVSTDFGKIEEVIGIHAEEALWYHTQGYPSTALAIWDYVAGIILYNYSLPKPLEELLIIYFQVRENSFFTDLGFESLCRKKDGQIQLKKVIYDIKNIKNKYQKKYIGLDIDTRILDGSHQYHFAQSYMMMIRNMDFPV